MTLIEAAWWRPSRCSRLHLVFDISFSRNSGAPRAFGELDPSDAQNTLITHIQIAPRSASDVLK